MIELLTAILVIITGFYAWVTYKILRANEFVLSEMKNQQESIYRPYISISPVVFPDNPILFLKIRNTGRTAANYLRLTIDKDFFQFGEKGADKNLKDKTAFSEIIDCFVPEAEMNFYLAQGFVIFGNNAKEETTPTKFKITACYEYNGKRVNETTRIDLRPYLNSAFPHDPIVDKLKDLNETIKKIKIT